jgi:hypothetical protein
MEVGSLMFGMVGARARRRGVLVLAVVASMSGVTAVAAQQGPAAATVTLFPSSDSSVTGSCSAYYVVVTDQNGQPVQGVTVDVLQVMDDARPEPDENRELFFCDPDPSHPRNPTGQGGTALRDVSGNNSSGTGGTRVHAEVGPTDADGEVAFGITMAPDIANAFVSVTAWVESDDDDQRDEGEPWDASSHQWFHADRFISSIDAGPESSTNPNGTSHTVTVVVRDPNGFPVQGFVPDSVILPSSFGRPQGDVVDPSAGSSPNATPAGAVPSAYSCTPTNAQGFSTCTFQDSLATPAGTDTVVFFWDRSGEARRPDGSDPGDAVQKTWMPVEQGPPTPTPLPPPTPTPSPTPPPTVSPTPAVTPSPTPGPGAAAARNVRLCQGSAVAPCDTTFASREPFDEHGVAALVTGPQGNPVANVPVLFTETGPAGFAPSGADAILVPTGPDGVARATLTSPEEGTSTVVAEISPPGTAGSFRGPGTSDDECEQPAGPGGAPPAGNCVSQTLTVYWVWPVNGHECDDAVDNDGDGLVDYPEDPGCTDEADGSEDPFHAIPPDTVRHRRDIGMHFVHRGGRDDRRLVVAGRVRLEDPDDSFLTCTRGQTVLIQRREHGEWITKEEATTNAQGRYSGAVGDRPGRYRATVERARVALDDDEVHECLRARKVKPHRHRG